MLQSRGLNKMPQLGEIKGGRELGYGSGWKFMWDACRVCGKERWVRFDWAGGKCKKCAGKEYTIKYSRENAPCWKGGRLLFKGYMVIAMQPTDFFYPMADKKGYVLEHRLVMAQHLGRCLHRWEIVHHKNHIRNDNRFENLQLVTDDRHTQITILERRIKLLEQRVTMLEAENVLLKQNVVVQ